MSVVAEAIAKAITRGVEEEALDGALDALTTTLNALPAAPLLDPTTPSAMPSTSKPCGAVTRPALRVSASLPAIKTPTGTCLEQQCPTLQPLLARSGSSRLGSRAGSRKLQEMRKQIQSSSQQRSAPRTVAEPVPVLSSLLRVEQTSPHASTSSKRATAPAAVASQLEMKEERRLPLRPPVEVIDVDRFRRSVLQRASHLQVEARLLAQASEKVCGPLSPTSGQRKQRPRFIQEELANPTIGIPLIAIPHARAATAGR